MSRFHLRRRMHPARCLSVLLLASLWASAPVGAKDYCVATPEEFRSALSYAGDSIVPDRIQVQQGSYHFAGSAVFKNNTQPLSLRIEGGYGPGCASRSRDPDNTVLDGDGMSGLVLNVCGELGIDGLTLTGFSATQALSFDGSVPNCFHRRSFRMSHSIVRGNSGNVAMYIGSVLGETRIYNTAIVDNDASDAALVVNASGPTNVDLSHLTVAGNSADGLRISGVVQSPRIWNGLFAGNAGTDLVSQVGSVALAPVLRGVLYGSASGSFATLSSAVQAGDPLFVDAAHGDYHLQAGSPAINAGSTVLMDGGWASDLDGNPRWSGSRPDLGAFESTVDDRIAFTVTNANDAGAGSLRQAILDANQATGPAVVRFSIGSTCGPKVINLASPLPSIEQFVEIDGFSQPGAQAASDALNYDATVCVVLRSSEADVAQALEHGLAVDAGSSGTLIARGLAFVSFVDAIALDGGAGHVVAGSRFDGHPSVAASFGGNQFGVRIGATSDYAQVGGGTPAMRNLISATSQAGVKIDPGNDGALVFGNLIGTSADGASAAANPYGVVLMGETAVVRDNVVSGNSIDGIAAVGTGVAGNSQRIDRNWIGLSTGLSALGNGGAGIHLYQSFNNRIGGLLGTGNTIAYNGGAGVWVESGIGNLVDGNRIFGNDTGNGGWLNIDLDVAGAAANDAGDADVGANNLQNAPVISAINENPDDPESYTLSYSLDGTANKAAYLSVYAHETCPAGGRGDLGTPVLTLEKYSATSSYTGTLSLPRGIPNASYLTLVAAIDADTSEPSPCLQAPFLSRITRLDSLEVSVGTLSPAFSDDQTTYHLDLPFANDSLTVSAQAEDPQADIRIDGESIGDGGSSSPIAIPVGPKTIEVVVTARDGVTTRTFYVYVERADNDGGDLAALATSAGSLDPAFNPSTTEYGVDTAFATTSTTVTATTLHPDATLSINGLAATSGQPSAPIALAVGDNVIEVQVTAADLSETITYYVYVHRADNANTRLQSLALGQGSLSPAFAANQYAYTASVDFQVSSITLQASAEETLATLRVNGVAMANGGTSAPLALAVGANVISLEVTAADGVTQQTTTITVTRAAASGERIFANGFED